MPITSEPKGPKPPLPGALKIQVNWQGSAGGLTFIAANVMHVVTSPVVSPFTTAELNTFASAFNTDFSTFVQSSVSSAWKVTSIVVTAVDGSGVQGSNATGFTGTGSPAYPPQCAVCITWKGAIPWRGGRPRTYLPGVPSSATAGSVASSALSSSYTAPLATAGNTFIAAVNSIAISGSATPLSLISYFTKGAFRPTPLAIPIQSAVVHDRLDSQRRRSGKERQFSID